MLFTDKIFMQWELNKRVVLRSIDLMSGVHTYPFFAPR